MERKHLCRWRLSDKYGGKNINLMCSPWNTNGLHQCSRCIPTGACLWNAGTALADSARPVQYMFSALTTDSLQSFRFLNNHLQLHLLFNECSSSTSGHFFCYSLITSFQCFFPCSICLVLERCHG